MKLSIYNEAGEVTGTAELSAKIFDAKNIRPAVVQLVATAAMANAHRATASTKTRGLVRGGGKKPWKQKGTGQARAGSIRSPLWRGGGITFGPSPERNYSKKVNRKTKRLGLYSVLSDRAVGNQILILKNLDLAGGKTKALVAKLQGLKNLLHGKRFLLISENKQDSLKRAARNLPLVHVTEAGNLNILDLLWADTLVILEAALPVLEKIYSSAKKA